MRRLCPASSVAISVSIRSHPANWPGSSGSGAEWGRTISHLVRTAHSDHPSPRTWCGDLKPMVWSLSPTIQDQPQCPNRRRRYSLAWASWGCPFSRKAIAIRGGLASSKSNLELRADQASRASGKPDRLQFFQLVPGSGFELPSKKTTGIHPCTLPRVY